jgi:tRNA 2-thiouridine synthesizing protein A
MSLIKLDVTGLNCPLPVLHARKLMQDIPKGTVVQILSSDPASVRDFNAFCKKYNNELLSVEEANGVFTFNIRKGG